MVNEFILNMVVANAMEAMAFYEPCSISPFAHEAENQHASVTCS